MATCNRCSAPLPANTNKCRYCDTRNDVDLTGKQGFAIQSQSERHCPHCAIPMQTINLNLGGPFLIERCEQCYGLFFDPGQVEALLESSVSNVFHINPQHLDAINNDRFQPNKPVKYVKCPVCQVLMNRNAYGYRSGVVIDRCKNHGIWLDSGEITHLMEWKKAGGQLLHEQQASVQSKKTAPRPTGAYANNGLNHTINNAELNVFDIAASVITKLFDF